MKFLLDTNVISELRKPRPHGAVVAWMKTHEGESAIPASAVGEMQAGIERTRRDDPVKAGQYSAWLEEWLESFPVIPMGTVEFREWAKLMHRRQAHLYVDAMIAATARVHALTVATRNVADFEPFGVATVNPFE
ncbi:MAG: type II toxin-antitoxin system VapC family toxin [Bryobacteraceae bacterium]|nr:type II toxin-antitoxin system VapC family toxin [Bryobacteraceae bacterium]